MPSTLRHCCDMKWQGRCVAGALPIAGEQGDPSEAGNPHSGPAMTVTQLSLVCNVHHVV